MTLLHTAVNRATGPIAGGALQRLANYRSVRDTRGRDLPRDDRSWLVTIDDPLAPTDESGISPWASGFRLAGDGPPESFRVVESTQVTVSTGFLTLNPGTSPTSADPVGYELEHLFASAGRDDDSLVDYIRTTQELRRPWTELRGRPPMLRFRYGPFNDRVWLSGAQYELPHACWPGTDIPVALRLRLSFTISREKRLRERPVRPRETRWHTLEHGQTFEDLALLHYGDISLAPLIRRVNAELLEEYPGARVKLLDLEHPTMQQSTGLVAPCFLESFHTTVQGIAEEQAERPGASWAALQPKTVMSAGTRSLYFGGD